jgi:amino acid transporter
VLAFFSITVLIYAIEHGVHGFGAGDFVPNDMLIFLGLVPLLLFNYVGFELQNGAAEEMQNPQHDVPVTVIQSGIVTVLAYSIPIFGILAVLPTSQITGIGGFLDAVHTTFGVYGGAQDFMTDLMAIGFIFALVTSGSVWMMGSDRILAVAAYDGAFPGYFGRFHPRLGTPVRVNVMSGIVSTIFMLAAVQLLSGSASAANTFTVVLYLATSTTLLSYLLIFPAGIKLRLSHGHIHRPYRLGATGNGLMWVCALVTTGWMLLGSWVAIFPGTLEELTGHSYSVMDSYGVTRLRFEVFTLGTLAIVFVVGVIGYLMAADVRAKAVDIPLEATVEPAAGD